MGTRGPSATGGGSSGSHSCQCCTQGLRPRGADRAPGRRGGAARGGARGAGRRRGGGTGWRLRLGAPRSPAPRAGSKARSVQSGERSPERESKGGRKGCPRVTTRDLFPCHDPAPGSRWRWRRAADGVHLSQEQAGEAGRSGASPARPVAASTSAFRTAGGRHPRQIATPGACRCHAAAGPGPIRSARGGAVQAAPAVGEPEAAAGELLSPLPPYALLLLLPLPPPSLRTWSPLSCRRRSRLVLSSARRGSGSRAAALQPCQVPRAHEVEPLVYASRFPARPAGATRRARGPGPLPISPPPAPDLAALDVRARR